MVAHGVSRGESAARAIRPEGGTSKDMKGSSKYRPPGSGKIRTTQPTACAVGYHLPPSRLKRQSLPPSG